MKRSIKRAQNRKQRDLRFWRPTVVAIVANPTRQEVLFVLSSGSGTWSPPKGGVDVEDGASLSIAMFRELNEEVQLQRGDFLRLFCCSPKYLGSAQDTSRPGCWSDKNQIGKNMHCMLAVAKPECQPQANLGENISEFRWIDSVEKFSALPMPKRRRAIWLAAMREARVPWAQEV